MSKTSKNIGQASANKIIARRKEVKNAQVLFNKLTQGNKTALSQAITIIESSAQKDQELSESLLKKALPHSGNSYRIGITGVPGVGKSTFIEALGNVLIAHGKKVAVLAVDPTSSLSHGSILGDKTRMETLSQSTHAFIRPSASGDSLGGVARKTRESIILCEAAGYDTILVETVGVGQSETAVHGMTDFFLLLKLAGAGDELQGIKRGIIEMADAILINKADGDNLQAAREARSAFAKALHLYPSKASGWTPKVHLCSGLKNEGIDNVWQMLLEYFKQTQENQFFTKKRKEQNEFWLRQTIENKLKDNFYNNPKVKTLFYDMLHKMNADEITSYQAAKKLLDL